MPKIDKIQMPNGIVYDIGGGANIDLSNLSATGEAKFDAKVDISSLLEVYPVISTWVNGTEGYRIWSDGYCEQWGYIATSTSWTTINLIKEYQDTDYLKMATNSGTASSTQSVKVTGTVTNSSFQILNSANSTHCYWKTCGYLADENIS